MSQFTSFFPVNLSLICWRKDSSFLEGFLCRDNPGFKLKVYFAFVTMLHKYGTFHNFLRNYKHL
jgi:hypothetical protein